jgi:hypothetical protein
MASDPGIPEWINSCASAGKSEPSSRFLVALDGQWSGQPADQFGTGEGEAFCGLATRHEAAGPGFTPQIEMVIQEG